MDIPELGFLMVLALILFGPEELPNIARKLGSIIYDIKKASQEVQQEVKRSVIAERDTAKYADEPGHRPDATNNTASEVEPELIDFSQGTDPKPIDLTKDNKEAAVVPDTSQQEFSGDDKN